MRKTAQSVFVDLWNLRATLRALLTNDRTKPTQVFSASAITLISRRMFVVLSLQQSRTQSPRAFWPAGERPERLWDNRFELYF